MASRSASPLLSSAGVAILFLITNSFCGGQPTALAFVSPHHPRCLASCNHLHNNGRDRQLSLYLCDQSLENFGRKNNRVSSNTSTTRLHLFGNLFGNEEEEEDQKDLREGELARFSHLLSADDNPNIKFDSLSIMISEWSKLFVADEDKKQMGLTTPVVVVELKNEGENDKDAVINYSGVQLLFQKGKTGGRSAYQDKDDEKNNDEKREREEDAIKEGGVEVKVEQLSGGGDLRVIASRCEIEEGTMVKEMSEQTIIDSLRKAMAAWKKEQAS